MKMSELEHLIHEIQEAKSWLVRLPDDHEWTQIELAVLEDVRHSASCLVAEVEATIETFEGK